MKVFCRVKNWRGGGKLFLLKMIQHMVTLANHVIAQTEITLRAAPSTLEILTTSSCKI